MKKKKKETALEFQMFFFFYYRLKVANHIENCFLIAHSFDVFHWISLKLRIHLLWVSTLPCTVITNPACHCFWLLLVDSDAFPMKPTVTHITADVESMTRSAYKNVYECEEMRTIPQTKTRWAFSCDRMQAHKLIRHTRHKTFRRGSQASVVDVPNLGTKLSVRA